MPKRSFRDRLMAKFEVNPETGCWIWTAAKNAFGYGVIGGPDPRVRKTLLAHRAMYVELSGSIPEGLDLDHLCRVRHCVNPSHLEPVTRRVNLLRGDTWTAQHAAATHCPQGHPYSGHNLIVRRTARGTAGRQCRACHDTRNRLARARKAAMT